MNLISERSISPTGLAPGWLSNWMEEVVGALERAANQNRDE